MHVVVVVFNLLISLGCMHVFYFVYVFVIQ